MKETLTYLVCDFRTCRKPATRKIGITDVCDRCYMVIHDRFVEDVYRVAFREWKQREEEHASVYFVRRSDGLIKIGYSGDLKQRLRNLRSEHGEVELLASLPGHRKAEQYVQSRFCVERVEGEWFAPSAALYAFINALQLDGPEAAFDAIDAVCVTEITEVSTEDIAWSQDRRRA